jgi:cellulose synthase/poly-beta-1,6-N-acetylglucosamine synthase-like glycosyltransferase
MYHAGDALLIDGWIVGLYALMLLFLMPYSYICYALVSGSRRYRAPELTEMPGEHPTVTVQLPIYREDAVFPRLLGSVSEMDWPRSRLEVLVLDDGGEASRLVEEEVRAHRSRGLDVRVVRRNGREGFKAGALNNALAQSTGEYILVLDADSIPPRDLLERTVPHLEADPGLAYVQVRQGHANRGFNGVSEAVSLALDCHFLVEQPGRQALSLVTNFNGSAGVLRREAILDMGGWNSETLTEDMHISYAARVRGWGSMYLRDVVVNGEVPVTLTDFKCQQARWAKGSTKTAVKLLGGIWRSGRLSLRQKIDSTVHLTNYLVFPAMLLSFFTLLLMAVRAQGLNTPILYAVGAASSLGALGVVTMYVSASLGGEAGLKKRLSSLGLLGVIGVGLSAHFTASIIDGLLRNSNDFVRTPKYNLGDSNSAGVRIRRSARGLPVAEALLAVLSALGLYLSLVNRVFSLTLSFAFHMICFLAVAYYTVRS